MSVELYDSAVSIKLSKWLSTNDKLRVLKPSETKRFFELVANDKLDKNMQLPAFMLSRDPNIELLLNIKNLKSFDGKTLDSRGSQGTVKCNVIPIKLNYQLNIYTKKMDEGLDYVRELLFKMINNPTFVIELPYNDVKLQYRTNIRVLPDISDISETSERIFEGQFSCWSIKFELQDAHLFNLPLRNTYYLDGVRVELVNSKDDSTEGVEEVIIDTTN